MIQASDEVIKYFEKIGNICKTDKNEMIYLQGDTSPSLYLISKGRVRMYFMGEEGKEITYQIIGEGQLFGESAFLSHAARPATICAVTEVTLISCQIDRLMPYIKQSPILAETILALLTDNYQFLCGQVRRLSVYDSCQKVASYLLEQITRGDKGIGVSEHTLPYTHEELAVCLNLNRVTVTRILNEFQKEGLVRLGRKKIQVVEPEGLKGKIKNLL